ncbi:MAG: 4Fe-4S dicluster domain-containing protein [Bacillota bacterium]
MLFNRVYSIKVVGDRCLNQRHHAVECRHCIDHCPAEAIIINERGLLIDEEKCLGCGLCLNDCPTQVFQAEHWDETVIQQDIKNKAWDVTEFFCGLHPKPFKAEGKAGRGAVQIPACLSIISRGAWYELGLATAIELHLEECGLCFLNKALVRLDYNIGMATEWLEASGHTAKISCITQTPTAKTKKNLKAIGTGLKITSRRDLFLSLARKGREAIGNLTVGSKALSPKPERKLEDGLLSDWQKRLSQVYQQNFLSGANPAYWPTIKKNNNCISCGLCVNMCPSGALQISSDETSYAYYFTSSLCLDCRICQLFCPKEAVSRDREQLEKPFERVNIFTAAVIECKKCGKTTVEENEGLCYWCKEKAANDNSLMRDCRNLFLKTANY